MIKARIRDVVGLYLDPPGNAVVVSVDEKSMSGYVALRVVALRPDLSPAQLSLRCFVRAQTMTRIVTQLIERGYRARGPHPESERAMALTLTPEGRTALEEMAGSVDRLNATLRTALDPGRIAEVNRAPDLRCTAGKRDARPRETHW